MAPAHSKIPQFRQEMKRGWDIVDEKFKSDVILGEKASSVLVRHAARASHHEFPFSMNVMAQLFSCTNGATTDIFPGTKSPLMMTMFNSNYPQTRKVAALPQVVKSASKSTSLL